MSTDDASNVAADNAKKVDDMSLLSITDGENDRGIPVVKFIEDVDAFSNSFNPPSSAELLIGAYSELHSKFKTFETSLTQKSTFPTSIILSLSQLCLLSCLSSICLIELHFFNPHCNLSRAKL